MKKLLKVVGICGIMLALVLVVTKTHFVQNVVGIMFDETENSENVFEDKWYFNQLIPREQEVYLKVDTVIHNLEKTVVEVGDEFLTLDNVSKALNAYFFDNPSVFYVATQYNVNEKQIFGVNVFEIKFKYRDERNTIQRKVKALNDKIDSIILEVVDTNMTDFEKEVALHDYLVKNVKYYNYVDIENIPDEKHTAYGALIDKSAVCDGISEAYSLLLDKCGITNIVVTGKLEEGHAWNKVLIEGEWYNVDTTSDICGENNVLSHVYFNLTDAEITDTHSFDKDYDIPECNSSKYNYYEYYDFKLTSKDWFSDKIRKIISETNKSTLEFKVAENFEIKTVVQELYNLNFNNYRTNNVSEIVYFYINNVIIVPKN